MAQEITIAKFKDVAEGLQPGQFSIGERENVAGLDGLDPIYKELLDRPITITLGLIGPDVSVGRVVASARIAFAHHEYMRVPQVSDIVAMTRHLIHRQGGRPRTPRQGNGDGAAVTPLWNQLPNVWS